jgi:dihydroxy-acid dehydratase
MATETRTPDLKARSREVTDGPERAPARSMLLATGLTHDDLTRPLIGVAASWNEVTPCNIHLNLLAGDVKKGIREMEATPISFHTISVSDGISMGHDGMRYSLPSRDLIADSVETMTLAERFDALVTVAGCDKSLPGMLIAMARLNLPGVFLFGGAIRPGRFHGRDVNLQDVMEAVGVHAAGNMSDDDLRELEACALPGAGSCAAMYTANTMASVGEGLGMSLPGSASIPAVDPRRREAAQEGGRAAMMLLSRDIRPRDILTMEAFENAIATIAALGGSSNAILHLLAIAYEIDVPLTLDDVDRVTRRTPEIANLRPAGKYNMADLDHVGGVRLVMRLLLDADLIHGEALTVTGNTVADNLASVSATPDGDVVRDVARAYSPSGGLRILRGNLAPDGCVAKTAHLTRLRGTGPARVFDSEEDATAAALAGRIQPGDMIVMRFEGPKGGPGMREMTGFTTIVQGMGLGDKVGYITDGRYGGGTRGLCVAHVAPEAYAGGPLAAVRDGDEITIDVETGRLDVALSDEEIEARLRGFVPPSARRPVTGVLAKYRKLVGSAALGAPTT